MAESIQKIIDINEKIIKSMKTQKVRAEQLITKYGDGLKEELGIPSNQFLPVVKAIGPYMDSVVSGKLSDYELMKQYETYVKELVKYNADYLRDEDKVSELKSAMDAIITIVIRLEAKLHQERLSASKDYEKFRLQMIKYYQASKIVPNPHVDCIYCGMRLVGEEEEVCDACENIPFDKLAEIIKVPETKQSAPVKNPETKIKEESVSGAVTEPQHFVSGKPAEKDPEEDNDADDDGLLDDKEDIYDDSYDAEFEDKDAETAEIQTELVTETVSTAPVKPKSEKVSLDDTGPRDKFHNMQAEMEKKKRAKKEEKRSSVKDMIMNPDMDGEI